MKNLAFSDFEIEAFTRLLAQAEQDFSNNGCNDFEVEVTDANFMDVLAHIHKTANNRDELADMLPRVAPGNSITLTDWILLSQLRAKLRDA